MTLTLPKEYLAWSTIRVHHLDSRGADYYDFVKAPKFAPHYLMNVRDFPVPRHFGAKIEMCVRFQSIQEGEAP
jgi:hypothetical protein